ncbi:MAG: phosphatidylinositol mannoside acyltransferase [Jatrophihabitans sp.]
MSRTSAVRDRAVDLGYAAGWRLVRALPESVATAAFRRGADTGFRRNGRGTSQLRRNLRRVVGPMMPEAELDELVRAGLRSYSRYWKETFRLPSMNPRQIVDRFQLGGTDLLDASMDAGNGVVLVLPHMGNWDVAGLWLVAHGVPFTTVAERLKPETLFDRFVAFRESLGMEIVPLTGGSRPAADVLTERLRAGGCICLVGERDLSSRGVEVQFFGETARMPVGPALLAARTGAALHPVGLWNCGPDWAGRVGPAITFPPGRLAERSRAGTQQVADGLAAEIADHPADWHMLQRLWLADL